MKKIIILALLASLLLLTGCSGDRVRISRHSVTDAYSVQESDKGYDIVIHAERIPEAE